LFRALGEVERDSGQVAASMRDKFVDRERFDRWLADYRACLRTDAQSDAERGQAMRGVNPKYVLRNYLAQMVIEKAERGDYAEIDRLLTVLHAPFEDHPSMAQYAGPPPDWAGDVRVSCSS
jgi:hypothetical protein